ncbi:MAG: acylphosphatase [Hyphomicrobiales bacterium]|nr:acylphosphatase [Hyphomicrobiales bacterium]
MRTVQVIVTGGVQGVGYRAWTERQAQQLGLDGWVRNRRDGSVEVLVCGDPNHVDKLLAAFRQGPPGARVDAVAISDSTATVAPGFKVLPSA